ncbi:MAG TPA: hypothetical protein VJ553_03960 [Candidatus Paceibacterota bacterium]|nr:hypothetical protein [Candidatus Paceibacterota bacterium]
MKTWVLPVLFVLVSVPAPAQEKVYVGFGSVDAGAVTGRPLQPALDVSVQWAQSPPLGASGASRWMAAVGVRKEGFSHSIGFFVDVSVGRQRPYWLFGTTRSVFVGASYGVVSDAYGGFEWTADATGRTVHQRWRAVSQNGGFVFAGPDSALESPTVIYPFVGGALERPLFSRLSLRAEVRLGIVSAITADATYDPRTDRLAVFRDDRSLALMPAYRVALGWRF